jgi:hypothetical protein
MNDALEIINLYNQCVVEAPKYTPGEIAFWEQIYLLNAKTDKHIIYHYDCVDQADKALDLRRKKFGKV